MKLLLKYAKPFILSVIAVIALLFVQGISELNLPNFMSDIVNIGIVKADTAYIAKTGLIMLGIALLSVVASILVNYLSTRMAAGVSAKMRSDVFKKVSAFSHEEFEAFGASSLITRTTNDITQVQNLIIMGMRIVFFAPIMSVGAILMVIQKSSSMTWIIALAGVILIAFIVAIFTIALPKFKIMQSLIDKLNLVSRENLTGIMVVRAFGTQAFEEKRFDKANRDLADTNLFINRVMIFMMPAMTIIMNVTSLLIIWIGAGQVELGALQVGDMMAFMQYAMQIIMSFLMIAMIFILVPRSAVSLRRIGEVLAVEPSIKNPEKVIPFDQNKRGVVEFKNVTFRYGDAEEDVLTDISFKAMPGKTTAFVGSTGAGKSTLINLIPRFFEATQGEILIDGVNIKSANLTALREKIGYVPQKGILLSGDIASNLRYGKQDATDEEIKKAASIAQATEFIESSPEGYAKPISQGGSNVSGGQKQRLSIARALATDAEIYIFDDSFSALDYKTDARLRQALKKELGDSTVLIVAQRVSTIMHAEQIIVLEDGQIVGRGTHDQLMESCDTYIEIASSQLGGVAK